MIFRLYCKVIVKPNHLQACSDLTYRSNVGYSHTLYCYNPGKKLMKHLLWIRTMHSKCIDQHLALLQPFASANLRADLPVRRLGDERRGGNAQ